MPRFVYDLSMLAGNAMISAGVAITWGAGLALIAAGALVILQTQIAVRMR